MNKPRCEEIKKNLKDGKFYLKTDYKTHVKEQDECPDHCARHAIGDRANKSFVDECYQNHDRQCNRCCKLEDVLDTIKEEKGAPDLAEDEVQRLLYEFEFAKSDIEEWKAHIMRTYNQVGAKHDCLESVDKKLHNDSDGLGNEAPADTI